MTNPVGPLVITVPTVPQKKAGMHSVPNILFRSIFQNLGAKDLQNAEGVCKSWQKFTEDPHVWKFIREKLRISGTKKEVLSYIREALPEINKSLISVLPEEFTKELSSVKHPFDQYISIENFLRTHIKDQSFKLCLDHNTDILIMSIGVKDFNPLQNQCRAVQILIDNGVEPFKTVSLEPYIYELNFPKGFEDLYRAYIKTDPIALFRRPILRNNKAFVQFLLNKVAQNKDWHLMVLASLLASFAYGDVKSQWDHLRGEVTDSMLNLIVGAIKQVEGLKLIFETMVKGLFDSINLPTPASASQNIVAKSLNSKIEKEKALERLQNGVKKLRALLFETQQAK